MNKIEYLNFYYSLVNILKIKKIFLFDFLTKKNINNLFSILKIKKIILTVSLTEGLKNETDLKIINSLNVLDFFFCKKSSIYSLLSKYLKKTKRIIFIAQSTINNWYLIYIFIYSVLRIIIPNLNKKFIFFKIKIFKDGFVFFIDDISSLTEVPDELRKEKINIKVSFFFNNIVSMHDIIFFLNYFGFDYVNNN